MSTLITVLFLLAAAINLVPIVGVVSASRLEALYTVSVAGADLAILMRHRAILLGLVGAVLGYAAFVPAARHLAFAVGLVSMASFIVILALEGEANEALRRVALADAIGIAILVAGWGLHLRQAATPSG